MRSVLFVSRAERSLIGKSWKGGVRQDVEREMRDEVRHSDSGRGRC